MNMPNLEEQILSALARKSYAPLKPKALARKLNVPAPQYPDFRRTLRSLLQQGRIEVGKLLRQVRKDVLAATSNQQEPMFSGNIPAEDLFFRPPQ